MVIDDSQIRYLAKMRNSVPHWNPERCREIDIRIARDGTWYHEGSPIRRRRMVELFSALLRRESDGGYVIVTPVEKLRIQVEDVPFLAIDLEVEGKGEQQVLRFITQVGEKVAVDEEHGLRIESNPETQEPSPYLKVREGLEARIDRSTFYQLATVAEAWDGAFYVWSNGRRYRLGDME